MRRTRAQNDLILAERCVSEVDKGADKETRAIYGRLCLQFPIFVLTCGLCQAVAFSKAKSQGDGSRPQAHKLLLKHIAMVLEVDEVLKAVRESDAQAYRRHTRRVLAAWVYFKRFAVSILKADETTGEATDEL